MMNRESKQNLIAETAIAIMRRCYKNASDDSHNAASVPVRSDSSQAATDGESMLFAPPHHFNRRGHFSSA
jgi:hypothetical protein